MGKNMKMMFSVVIPNRNKEHSLAHCLTALYGSGYRGFEVIVVDDASEDGSVAVAQGFPCTLICLHLPVGAAEARNIGARRARGQILFFIDSDCVVRKDTLAVLAATDRITDPQVIIAGTYTEKPFDSGFFSFFQSVFIHYSETRRNPPDYAATHALAMNTESFRRSGGFARNFLPILEDVDFSHRMQRLGYRLCMNPQLQVRHDFRFGLRRSLINGFSKARFWFVYSLMNKDLLADSGTASRELKVNLIFFASLLLAFAAGIFIDKLLLPLAGSILIVNLLACRRLLSRFFTAGGLWFGIRATTYFLFFYPVAVWAGAVRGLFDVVKQRLPFSRKTTESYVGMSKRGLLHAPLLETRK